jgi:CMP-N,N'-diacetyllegionaminic acid synthase
MSTLAIIPARGGSKGIPGKNLADVAGRPLISWSIRQALRARLVDRAIVTTDSEEIAAVARQWGAETPFMRPAHLATDTATTESAMFHALDELAKTGYEPETVVLLQPTCPVRKPGSIDAAITLLETVGADSVVGVREIHPFLWYRPQDARADYDYRNRPRRQDVPDDERTYEETGCLYLARTAIMKETGNRIGGRIALYQMENVESIDIDAPSDLVVATAILTALGLHDY